MKVDPKTGRQKGDALPRTLSLHLDSFALSPDGQKALITRSKSRSNVWMFPLKTPGIPDFKNGKRLTSGDFTDFQPRLIPQRDEVCFLSNRRGKIDAWKLSLNQPQSTLVRLTSGQESFGNITVSPDGSWIALSSKNVYLMRSDGSGFHLLEPFGNEFSKIRVDDWSQDGRYIAFTFQKKYEYNSLGLATVDVKKGEVLRTFPLGILQEDNVRLGQTASFSPDGSYICYESSEAGNFDIWITSIDGKEVRKVVDDVRDDRHPHWTSDPSFIYFQRNWGDRPGIYRIPMGENGNPMGEPEFCFKSRDGIRYLWGYKGREFFDGKALFSVIEDESDIWLIQLSSKTE